MITKKELAEIARLKGLNMGNAEKDYLLDVALLSISKNTKNELVFKGGTCLYKFYRLDRFSEDLDFSAIEEIDMEKLISGVISDFEKFGIKATRLMKREPYNSFLISLRIEGPLFAGKPVTYAKLGIDINVKSPVVMKPELLSYAPFYQEIPSLHIPCMQPKEIFAEKIRAIMTRQRARDLFDIYFLIEKGFYSGIDLINKKLEYYNKVFDMKKLISKINSLEPYWKKELRGLTSFLPEFNEIRLYTLKRLKELY